MLFRSKPDKLPEVIHKIRELLIFDRDDERYDFYRQRILFDILIDGVNKENELLSILFYELSETFLSYVFQQFKGGRNNSFIHYQYPIPNNNLIQEFRNNIWDTLDSSFIIHPEMAFNLLKSYSRVYPDVNNEIMEFDIPFILKIINKHLSIDNFEHCKYVQSQIRWFKRNAFDLPEFSNFTNRFINDTFLTFLKIDWDRFRDKEMYEFDDFREYEKLKEAEIRSSFIFHNIDEIDSFYDTFIQLKKSAENNWKYNDSLDFVIDENCSRNIEIGLTLLEKVIEKENEIKYIPRSIFRNHLKTENTANQIWNIIQSKEFELKELWELSFYD